MTFLGQEHITIPNLMHIYDQAGFTTKEVFHVAAINIFKLFMLTDLINNCTF